MKQPMFWYLATPYSKYPAGLTRAFEDAAIQAARLIERGLRIYSPIAHTHPVATHGNIDPLDHDIWLALDEAMMHAAVGLIVCRMESWQESHGIKIEIEAFQKAGKPVLYMDPLPQK
ncbi:MAG: DUF1937 family protein [Myxococcales bacterium]|nr:MAG: DUF1937 family protein [Myxococcales bacterium]